MLRFELYHRDAEFLVLPEAPLLIMVSGTRPCTGAAPKESVQRPFF